MENNTNDLQDTSVGDGKNTEDTEGTSANTDGAKAQSQEKLLSQSEVNRLVAKARDEGRKSGKDAALKDYEGKHVLTDDDLAKIRGEAADAALKERALQDVKKAIQTEYGLTDAQLERISGDDEKSLRDDAELLFGLLKQKKAPVINAGGTEQKKDDDSANKELNDWLRETTPKTKRF